MWYRLRRAVTCIYFACVLRGCMCCFEFVQYLAGSCRACSILSVRIVFFLVNFSCEAERSRTSPLFVCVQHTNQYPAHQSVTMPSNPHGTQALTNPYQPDVALMACPPVTVSSEPWTAAQQHPAQQQQQQQQPHPPPLELPPRSQRDPQRGDLLAFMPSHPIVMDVCVSHPLAASAVAAAAWTTGATAEAKDALKRNNTAAPALVPAVFNY